MTKFTRINQPVTHPRTESRVFGEKVTVGEPFQIRGDAELREQVENSLELMAKQRLLEAENKAEKIIKEAEEQAKTLLEKSNAQAREMISLAEGQVDQIKESAYEQGFKTGFQEGYTDATEQVGAETRDLLQGVQTMVDGAYEAEKRVLKDFEKHALQLVRHVVQKVLRRELQDAPETVLGMIEQAIEGLYLSGKVRVVVSAQTIQELREFSAKTEEALDIMSRFELVADPALDLHQIYIVSQEGSFELTPDVQTQQLLAPLEKALELPRPEPTEKSAPNDPEVDTATARTEQAGEIPQDAPVDMPDMDEERRDHEERS